MIGSIEINKEFRRQSYQLTLQAIQTFSYLPFLPFPAQSIIENSNNSIDWTILKTSKPFSIHFQPSTGFFIYFIAIIVIITILKAMKILDNFANTNNDPQIFPNAKILPPFFENNLVDPARVVKHFRADPQANIRVFYYQYLKLCFELQSVDFESYIRKIQEIINNEVFKFMFFEDDDPQIFNDLQFKHLIMEFFGVLGQGGIGIQQAINYYPIMDTVFIYFFRAILILTGKTDALDSYIEREDLFQFLCGYFNVEISTHQKCIKFVETDIFVYEEDPSDVYMAYMEINQEEEPEQEYHSEEVIQQSIVQPKIENLQTENMPPYYNPGPVSQSSQSQRGTSQNNKSYISSEFIDYTNPNLNLQAIVKKDNLKQSGEIPNNHSFGKILENPMQGSISDRFQGVMTTESVNVPPVQAYQPPKTISSGINQPNKYTNASGLPYSANYQAAQPKPKSNENAAKTTSHHQDTPFSKKSQEVSYVNNDWAPTPTKDPGFSKYTVPEVNYQANTYGVANKKPQESFQDKYGIKKPTSYTPYEDKYESKKPASSFQSSKPGSNQYNPSINPYNPSPMPYNTNFATNSNLNIIKPPSTISNPSASSYKPPSQVVQIQPSPVYSSSKGSYLNVSLEFTNSFTMKVMAEPHKTNVRDIRNRAREHRKSLINILK